MATLLTAQFFSPSLIIMIDGRLEIVHNSRRFMSGLPAAARNKAVIAIKGGRDQQGSRASHKTT